MEADVAPRIASSMENSLISNETEIRLGGYLVCHMSDFRFRINEGGRSLCRQDLGAVRINIECIVNTSLPQEKGEVIESTDRLLENIAKRVRPIMLPFDTRNIFNRLYERRIGFLDGASKVDDLLMLLRSAVSECGG